MELRLDRNRTYGLVLEGGGARGAYQIGAWRALKEAGIAISGIAGTSVGALNGALVCMDDLERAERIWKNIRWSHVMDVDDKLMEAARKMRIPVRRPSAGDPPDGHASGLVLGKVLGEAGRIIRTGGFDVTPLRRLIEGAVDEERIRSSGRELYAVTYSLTDHCPLVVDICGLPDGEMAQMLMASAYLAGFKREKIGGKYYSDGCRANNVPVDVLIDRGYKDIIVIRIYGPGVDAEKHLKVPEDVNLYHIAPRTSLGGILEFDGKKARRNMALGYFDGLRMLYGLSGRRYYLDVPAGEAYYCRRLAKEAGLLARLLGEREGGSARYYTEELFPKLARELRLGRDWDYRELYLGILERLAAERGAGRLRVYGLKEFWERAAGGPRH